MPIATPDPLPLPAPVWLLWAFLTLMFVLHVVPMNLLIGGSIIGAVSRLRGRRDPRAAALAGWIARILPVIVAATVTPGVAALLFLQVLYGRVFFSAAVVMAVPWIAVVPLLIVAYGAMYFDASTTGGRPGPRLGLSLSWLIALLVMAIAFVFSNAMSLLLRPPSVAARFLADAGGLHLNLDDPTLAPRVLHIMLGALAVGGAGVACGGLALRRRDADLASWAIRHGAMWCAGATAINLLPGFWWLATLPSGTLLRFMGRDAWATLWIAGGILAGLAALGHLIPAAFAPKPASLVVGGSGSLVVSVACMAMVRDVVRRADLDAVGFRPTGWVEPQWTAIALFVVLLLGAIVTIAWMVGALRNRG